MAPAPGNLFPNRLLANRPYFRHVLAHFLTSDFDNYAESTWELRDMLRGLEPTWRQPEVPAALLERQPLNLGDPRAINPDAEDFQAWAAWSRLVRAYHVPCPRLEEEVAVTRVLIDFHRTGQNTFMVPAGLPGLPSQSACNSIRRAEIQVPFPCIYLHFEVPTAIELPLDLYRHLHELEDEPLDFVGPYQLEGAFVQSGSSAALEIVLTFRNRRDDFRAPRPLAQDYRFPTVAFSLDFGHANQEQCAVGRAVFSFISIWDRNREPAELGYGRIQELLTADSFEFESEQEEYKLFDQTLRLIIPFLTSAVFKQMVLTH